MLMDAKKNGQPEEAAPDERKAVGRTKKSAAQVPSPRMTTWTNTPMDTIPPPANKAIGEIRDLGPTTALRRNPTDFSISLRNRLGTDQQLHNPGKRQQSMRGFEDHYTDIVDYIIRATHRAWEEKDIGYVYDFYRHNIVVRDEGGINYGRDRVIENSLGLMNAFPDMRWLPGEIIWSGDDENGFHTSHRGMFVGTNTGWSQFGPPTGRRCTFFAMANCIAIGNEIYDEWVIENSASLIQQLGLDVRRVAGETAAQIGIDQFALAGSGEPDRLQGQGKPAHMPPPSTERFDPEDFVRRMLHYVWNWRLIGMTRDYFAANIRAFGPCGRATSGIGDYMSDVVARLATFPDLALGADDVYWMGNDAEGYMVAARWSLVGTHRGHGIYGKPTGRRVRMWGISHFNIRDRRIVEEWTMYNEFNVLQQIAREEPLPGA
jgi:predicted ester cyclase